MNKSNSKKNLYKELTDGCFPLPYLRLLVGSFYYFKGGNMGNSNTDIKWIKITTNMFDDEKIKIIESMPEADMILVIWVKLLTLAGRKNMNGYIFLTENIPYTDEMLSTLFNRPLNTIRLALETFKNFSMIEFGDNGFIKITNWGKHQNVEGMEKIREQNRIRQARKRGIDKLLTYQSLDNNNICAYCGQTGELTIDHIIPTTKGGTDDTSNKVLCCLECNQSKNNRDLAEFLNSKIRMNETVNINSIVHNKKLMKYIEYKDGVFIQRNTMSRDSHTPEEKRREKIRLDREKTREEKDKNNINTISTIIEYLNKKTGKNYKSTTKAHQRFINARLKEGFTLDDFKKVIDNKVTEWKGRVTRDGQNMENYLRPQTLFGTKFDSYLNQKPKTPKKLKTINEYAKEFDFDMNEV